MKKVLALLMLFVPLLCLSAQVYKSNQLGQMLESVNEIGSHGYFLEITDGTETLYLDSMPVLRTATTYNGLERIVVETNLLSNLETIKTYREGRLTSVINGSIVESYIYVDGQLSCHTRTNAGESELVVFFIRSSGSGGLVAVRQGEELRLVSDDYVYEGGSLFELLSGNLVVQGGHEVLEDGTIKVIEGETAFIYDTDGRILFSENPKTVTKYSYEGSHLRSIVTDDGFTRREETYQDGKASSMSVYTGNEIESVTAYRAEGNIQTIYKGGRVVATVYYKSDNRTIERIEYR